MKMIRFSSLLMVALVASLFTFNSCEKDNAAPVGENETVETMDDFAFSKVLTLTDAAGTSSVEYKIASDDQAELDGFTVASFDLIPIPVGANTKDVVDAFYADLPVLTEEDPSEAADADNGPQKASAGMQMVSQTLAPGIAKVVVTIKPEGDDLRGWKYYNHYSVTGQDTHASIIRTSFWRRVYFGLKYKKYSSSGWSTIVSQYRKLSNNEEYSTTRTPCHQFYFRVKTKKNTAYTVEFSED